MEEEKEEEEGGRGGREDEAAEGLGKWRSDMNSTLYPYSIGLGRCSAVPDHWRTVVNSVPLNPTRFRCAIILSHAQALSRVPLDLAGWRARLSWFGNYS